MDGSNQFAFLWFYEWYLFDAVLKGEHTAGTCDWEWQVNENGEVAQMDGGWLKLNANAAERGADLSLENLNASDHDWPNIAFIIPCFNPGDPTISEKQNSSFLDKDYMHTYFLGNNGLDLIKGEFPRKIHFNHECKSDIKAWEKEDKVNAFVFDGKCLHLNVMLMLV